MSDFMATNIPSISAGALPPDSAEEALAYTLIWGGGKGPLVLA